MIAAEGRAGEPEASTNKSPPRRCGRRTPLGGECSHLTCGVGHGIARASACAHNANVTDKSSHCDIRALYPCMHTPAPHACTRFHQPHERALGMRRWRGAFRDPGRMNMQPEPGAHKLLRESHPLGRLNLGCK